MSEGDPRGPTTAATMPTRPEAAVRPGAAEVPGLVLAFKPGDVRADDRAPLDERLVVGRSSSSTWRIPDERLSRIHFEVGPGEGGVLLLRDLESRNGTWVDGLRVAGARPLTPGTVVRAGGCVFVVVPDLAALAPPGEPERHGIAGRFHAGAVVRELRVAARTGRHLLVEGESGTGKELAARAIHEILGELGRKGPFVATNAACFAGEDDAVTALFGVDRGVFTGVDARAGALEEAASGTLFIDEVHNFPARVQRSLLRFAEDGLLRRIGKAPPVAVDVRLVLGTNVAVDAAVEGGVLAHDLVARLHRVALPPLRERRADLPEILRHVVLGRVAPEGEALLAAFDAAAVEELCLRDHGRGNVRELEELVAVAAARVGEGEGPEAAVAAALAASRDKGQDAAPPGEPASPYERHREAILRAYDEVGGNLSRLEETLKARGVPCTRRWLAAYLDRWGVRPIRRKG